jgi:hypothetical protein
LGLGLGSTLESWAELKPTAGAPVITLERLHFDRDHPPPLFQELLRAAAAAYSHSAFAASAAAPNYRRFRPTSITETDGLVALESYASGLNRQVRLIRSKKALRTPQPHQGAGSYHPSFGATRREMASFAPTNSNCPQLFPNWKL